MEKKSTATKANLANDRGAVVFRCPKCGETEIVRTSNERANAVKYTCSKCGFTGPN